MLHSAGGNVTVLDIRNGIGDMLNRVIYGAFGVPHQLDTGFEATSALKQGFLAKDGQTILEAMSTLYPLISGNEAKPLLVIGTGLAVELPEGAQRRAHPGERDVVGGAVRGARKRRSREALALSDLSDDFAAPAGLPASELATLRQAFSQAASLPALKAQAVKESLPLSFIGGAAVSGQVNTALANSSSIAAVRQPVGRLLVSTKTTTKVAHYHVQKQRRAEFIETWRANQRTVVALEDVEMHDTSRRMRRGVYVGADGGRPTRSMDATAHEIDPGAVSTVHRHSWDAMVFCVAGEAWTEIDGKRIDWGPGDSLHLPAWSWHRHGNEGSATSPVPHFFLRAHARDDGHGDPGRRR